MTQNDVQYLLARSQVFNGEVSEIKKKNSLQRETYDGKCSNQGVQTNLGSDGTFYQDFRWEVGCHL